MQSIGEYHGERQVDESETGRQTEPSRKPAHKYKQSSTAQSTLGTPPSSSRLTIHGRPNVLLPLHPNKPRLSLPKRLHANMNQHASSENYPRSLIPDNASNHRNRSLPSRSSERRVFRASQKTHATGPRQHRQHFRTPVLSSSTGTGSWEPYLSRRM